MDRMDKFVNIIKTLRSENGCPWDKEQTHSSLKAPCIEEAAEVICGINILDATGDPDNLKEELGDLLMQVVMHACIAEEEGLFTFDDVVDGISSKMIHRHPHVFGGEALPENRSGWVDKWEELKAEEKAHKKKYESAYLKDAFDESKKLIETAKKRKGFS